MKVRIETADLERELEGACRQLAQSGLPHILAEVDAGAFGTTPLNLQALDATAHAVAVAAAASKKLNADWAWSSTNTAHLLRLLTAARCGPAARPRRGACLATTGWPPASTS